MYLFDSKELFNLISRYHLRFFPRSVLVIGLVVLHMSVALPACSENINSSADAGTVKPIDAGAVPDAAHDDANAAGDVSSNDADHDEAGIRSDVTVRDVTVADVAATDIAALDHLAPFDATISPDASHDDASPDADANVPDAALSDHEGAWPFDANLPEPCAEPAFSQAGTDWGGWCNLQWPNALSSPAEQAAGPIYGQVYLAGQSEAAGATPGLQAQLLYGPWGTLPTSGGRCWNQIAAHYNTACDDGIASCGNNDEYLASLNAPRKPGRYALYYRYRLDDGRWLYGDRDGSDNGLQVDQAASLQVTGLREDRLVVATLNLRCRLDDWPARRPLVVAALARIDADLIAFQEDCTDAEGRSQSQEISDLLSTYSRRGYWHYRQQTHISQTDQGEFGEGISILSSLPWTAMRVLDLPPTPPVAPAHFPRKALVADFVVHGQALRFYVTHLEYGWDNADTRRDQVQAILDDNSGDHFVLIAGDFNDVPDSTAIQTIDAQMHDLWNESGVGEGLSFPAESPTRRIDYIFSSDPINESGTVQGIRQLDEHDNQNWLSDHRGLASSLNWP